jgi:NAD(P)-dependent dehydrogenase (short-subunit alcohol dehydrogenase family)
MADMTGQVALVTGGARGIGRAISERLASRGMKVAVGYSSGKETAQELAGQYDGMTIHQGNIGSREDCERVVQEVYDAQGRIDVLVNNAGITADKMMHKMEVDDWDRVVQVNLSGTFYMSQLAYLHMAERGMGRIVSISSVIGEKGNAGQVNYAATKSGLFGMTMSMAQEGARKGVTVNCVAPGYIETDMVAAVPEKAMEKILSGIPLRRLGQPDEVARVVEFLSDPESGYITGQVYSVNGGMHMDA